MNPFAITPDVTTVFLTILCGFILKVSAAYIFCWLLTRFATSAATRFVVWLSYLTVVCAYWIYSVAQVYSNSLASAAVMTAPAAHPSGFTWTLSTSVVHFFGYFLGLLFLSYVAVVIVLALLGGWRRIQLARALSYRTASPEKLTPAFEGILSEMRISHCSLWLLSGLTSPATLGWLKPAVYLPIECGDEEPAELQEILRHELSHVSRKDSLWEYVSRFSRVLVFFHPLVHKAFARLRVEREMACDMVVIRAHPEKRHLYADTLIRFGWKTAVAEQPDYIGIGFTSQSATLKARVKSILNGERVYSKWSLRGRALLNTGIFWLFATLMPALWVGFKPTVVPQTLATLSHANLHSHIQVHRNPRSKPILKIAPAFVNTVTDATNSLPEISRSTSHAVHYHVQNADEPMSNPIPDQSKFDVEAAGDPGPSATPSRANLPSATTVLTDAATRLSQMGIGGDHDLD